MGLDVEDRERIEQLPDKMTGKDLLVQEAYEASVEKQMFDSMDYVDRRDRQLHIVSRGFSRLGRLNYDNIKWD